MLSVEDIACLEEDDVVEVAPLFGGLTDKPVVLRVVRAEQDPLRVIFISTWWGVTLGRWSVLVNGGEVHWTM